MEDIKVFVKKEKELETLTGKKFGIEKCTMLIMKSGKRHWTEGIELPNQDKIRTLEEKYTYKYLGVLEADTCGEVRKIKKEYPRTKKKPSFFGQTLRTKIYEGGYLHRLQACWWLTRSMQDRQTRPRRLQLKVWSDIPAEAPSIFLLRRLSLRLAPRESSKVETTWWTMQHQAWWSVASIGRWWWSMCPLPRVFLRESLKRFFGAPLSQ